MPSFLRKQESSNTSKPARVFRFHFQFSIFNYQCRLSCESRNPVKQANPQGFSGFIFNFQFSILNYQCRLSCESRNPVKQANPQGFSGFIFNFQFSILNFQCRLSCESRNPVKTSKPARVFHYLHGWTGWTR